MGPLDRLHALPPAARFCGAVELRSTELTDAALELCSSLVGDHLGEDEMTEHGGPSLFKLRQRRRQTRRVVDIGFRYSRFERTATVSEVDEPITAEFLRLAQRDDDAFRALQERFARVVWASTYGFRLDGDTRDDIAQLVWLNFFQNLDKIRDPTRVAGWLATTTRRECLRTIKARARVQLTDQLEQNVDPNQPELDTNLLRAETVRHVAEALGGIGEECRQLLRLLTTTPPLSYEDIAETLGWPIGSIGPRRQRCLERLARQPAIVRITAGRSASEMKRGEP
jgi:RNA polymerase sigma factor (sigma-70 family)